MSGGPPLGVAARLVARHDALWFRAPALGLNPGVVHGLTHASLGNFSLTQTEHPNSVRERREKLLRAAGFKSAKIVAPPLHHGAEVALVEGGRLPPGPFDALISKDRATVLAVTVADCAPVFFVDLSRNAFGIAHAGWRGLKDGIVKNVVGAMREELGVDAGDLLVGVGPAIRGPCYEVGPEVAGLFPEEVAVPVGDPAAGHVQLDLPSFALAEARASGVPPDNLVDFALCTYTHESDLFSHRRGDRKRHWAFIGRP